MATKQEELKEELKEALENVKEINIKEDETKEGDNLSDLDLSEFIVDDQNLTKYTTDILNKVEEMDGTISATQLKGLIDYNIKGGLRPDFADLMLTQANAKVEETLKIISLVQLLQIPQLIDAKMTLQRTLLSPEILKKLSYSEMSEIQSNLSKEIKDILDVSLKITAQVNRENQIPTSVEKIANALMGMSASARKRIEEIIQDYNDDTFE